MSKVLMWAGIVIVSSTIRFYEQHQRLATYKASVCNGQFKVFLKIGIYSMASRPSAFGQVGGGRVSLWINRSGKLPRNGHFMFLQHLRSSRLTFTFGKGPESNGKLQQLAMLVTRIRRHISVLRCSCSGEGECRRIKVQNILCHLFLNQFQIQSYCFSQVINT